MADNGVRVKLDLSDFVEGALRFRYGFESFISGYLCIHVLKLNASKLNYHARFNQNTEKRQFGFLKG